MYTCIVYETSLSCLFLKIIILSDLISNNFYSSVYFYLFLLGLVIPRDSFDLRIFLITLREHTKVLPVARYLFNG